MLPNSGFNSLITRILDIFSILSCAYLAYVIRFHYEPSHEKLIFLSAIGALLFQVFSSFSNIYNSWRGYYGFSLARNITISWGLSGLSVLAILTLTKTSEDFSRLWLIYWWSGSYIALLLNKAVVYGFAAKLRTRGANHKKVTVIGNTSNISDIKSQIEKSKWTGFDILNTFSIENTSNHGNLIELSISKEAQEIWIAMPITEGPLIQKILNSLRNHTQNVRLIPSVSDLRLLNHKVNQVAGLQLIDLSVSPLDEGSNAIIKRLFDISFSLITLIFISPVMLIIAAIIKITSPGPALFKQDRNGIHGKEISVYKFRSMHAHKEQGMITQATKNDNRITPVGAFLRKSSLDELPQFINVLQGKMSVVGPRPHAVSHNEEYSEIVDSYMRRHKVKPGITGWAQINGYRGETDTLDKMEKRVDFDLYYIDNWSIWFDIKIVVMTVFKGFFDKNAY